MTISPETKELVREAWAKQIPEPYRYTGRDHARINASFGAIIAPPPPGPLLKKFLRFFECVSKNQHLTDQQKRDSAKHCYNSVHYQKRRTKDRPSRARAKPSPLPTVGDSGAAEIADLF